MPNLLKIFALHAAALAVAWLILGRKLKVPGVLMVATGVVYLTVPLFVAVKGLASVVYLSDVALPALLIYLALSRKSQERRPGFAPFIVLLFVLPMVAGVVGALARGISEFDRRGLLEMAIWYYRNVTLIATFYLGAQLRITSEQFHDFAKLVVLLGCTSAALGMLSYFGPFNFAVFEQLEAVFNPEFAQELASSKIGAGFLGLFRASVGQWYATIVVLSVAISSSFNLKWKLISYLTVALGIGAILLSYSRAGVVGLICGLVVLGLVSARGGQRLAVVAAAILGVACLLVQPDLFEARLASIVTHDDTASAGRLEAWQRSLHIFAADPLAAVTGFGATNQQEVFEAIGAFGAHNEYIDVIFRMGVTGPLVLIWAMSMLAARFWSQRFGQDRSVAAIGATGLALLAANAVMGLTQEHLVRTYSGYTCGLLLYLLYGALVGVQAQAGRSALDVMPVLKPANLMA